MPTERKRRYSSKRLQKIAKEIGYEKYVCLHSFTTRCQIELYMSAEDLKIFTGDTTPKMVANYSYPRFDDIKEKLRQLA